MSARDAGATADHRVGRAGIRTLILMGGVIVALFALGFGLLIAATSGQAVASTAAFGFGTGILALTLGMRHAFDADHIAAIDNTTRKLVAEGKRPLAVGFFFSLGHSTIVFLMVVLLGFGIRALNLQVQDDDSTLHLVTGVIGTTVSASFLYLIAAVNILVLISIVRSYRRLRSGGFDEREFEAQLRRRGLLSRIFGRIGDRIDASWKMYPLGMLFGLGFDTATEVTLLVLAGASVVGGVPWWAMLSLPFLFAAGMSLFDTLDGAFINIAYRWAFVRPARRVYYNVVITVLSVFIAIGIGTVEILALLAERFGWTGPFWDAVGGIDLNTLGFVVVGVLAATWLIAIVVWKVGRFERGDSDPRDVSV